MTRPLSGLAIALAVAIGLIAMVALAPRFNHRTAEAVIQSAPNHMSLDATAGGTVDTTRAVAGIAPFSVGVHVTQSAGLYKGYQWEIEFPPAGLAFDGGTAENTAATNLTTCTAPQVNSVPPVNAGDVIEGNGAGCISTDATFAGTNFNGQTTTFNMHCVADGTFTVLLLDVDQDSAFGSSLADATGTTLLTATSNITITCSGTGGVPPTSTPAPDTATPTATNTVGPTSTPTETSTPCVGVGCPTSTSTLPPAFTRTPTPTGTAGAATAAAGTPGPGGGGPTLTGPTTGGGPGGGPGGTGTGPRAGTINLPNTGTGGVQEASPSWFVIVQLGLVGALGALILSVELRRRSRLS